jgi:hypothetical protein
MPSAPRPTPAGPRRPARRPAGGARATTLRTTYRPELTDAREALKHYLAAQPDAIKACLQSLADADVRARDPHHPRLRHPRRTDGRLSMDRAALFAEWYGVGPVAGRVCAALYSADTRPLTVDEIRREILHAPASVRAALVALRQAMDPGALVTDGLRYALTDDGMDDCYAAIADARRRARRAAA